MLTENDRRMILDGALRQVNVARAALGGEAIHQMPIATPGYPSDCGIQRALRDLVPNCSVASSGLQFYSCKQAIPVHYAWHQTLSVPRSNNRVMLPSELSRFVSEFDAFGLPEVLDPSTFKDLRCCYDSEAHARWDEAAQWLMQHGRLSRDEFKQALRACDVPEGQQVVVFDSSSELATV